MPRTIDLTGRKIGYFTVLGYHHSHCGTWWVCQCSCGKKVVRPAKGLLRHERNHDMVSCGCHSKDNYQPHYRHGLSQHPLHGIWRGMRDRCRNPKNRSWKWYGECGIDVCARWDKFENFYSDMIGSWRPGLTIDRIDSQKGYSPGNCRWVSQREQTRNTRRNIKINGVALCDLAQQHGLNVYTVYGRYESGCDIEQLFLPCSEYRKARALEKAKSI